MKCKCGNELKIKMGAKVKCGGCHILTSITSIITAQCDKCKAVFQVPVSSESFVIKEK